MVGDVGMKGAKVDNIGEGGGRGVEGRRQFASRRTSGIVLLACGGRSGSGWRRRDFKRERRGEYRVRENGREKATRRNGFVASTRSPPLSPTSYKLLRQPKRLILLLLPLSLPPARLDDGTSPPSPLSPSVPRSPKLRSGDGGSAARGSSIGQIQLPASREWPRARSIFPGRRREGGLEPRGGTRKAGGSG